MSTRCSSRTECWTSSGRRHPAGVRGRSTMPPIIRRRAGAGALRMQARVGRSTASGHRRQSPRSRSGGITPPRSSVGQYRSESGSSHRGRRWVTRARAWNSANKELGTTLLITETTYACGADDFECRPMPEAHLKGKSTCRDSRGGPVRRVLPRRLAPDSARAIAERSAPRGAPGVGGRPESRLCRGRRSDWGNGALRGPLFNRRHALASDDLETPASGVAKVGFVRSRRTHERGAGGNGDPTRRELLWRPTSATY